MIALLTLSLSHDSAQQAKTANEQFRIMKGQLGVMEADQRPWLKVEVFPGNLWTFLPSDKMQFPTMIFGPHFKVTNVGKSPAFNARLDFLGYPISKNHSDPYAGQKEHCERIRNMPIDNSGRGHVLFPNDFFDEATGTGAGIVGFMGPEWRQFLTEEKDGSLSVVFYVIGCADYVFGEPLQHHQTGFVYEIYRVTDRERNTLDNRFIIGQNVSRDAIKFIPGPRSSLAD